MATEPLSFTAGVGVTAAGVVLVSQAVLGDAALVALGALCGCMHSVRLADTRGSAWRAALFILRWVFTALVLAGAVGWVGEQVGFPAHRWPAAVGLFITLFANHWLRWADELVEPVLARWRAKVGAAGARPVSRAATSEGRAAGGRQP